MDEGILCRGFAPHILDRDYPKHKDKWSAVITKEQYAEKARRLLSAPVGGDIKGFDDDGFRYRYDSKAKEFGMMSDKGYIITFFKPEHPKRYWRDIVRFRRPDTLEGMV